MDNHDRRQFFGTLAAIGSALWAACNHPPVDADADGSAAAKDLRKTDGAAPDLAMPNPYGPYGPYAVPCGTYQPFIPYGHPPYGTFTYPYGYRVSPPYGPTYCYYPYFLRNPMYSWGGRHRDRRGATGRRDEMALFERLTNRPRRA